MRTAIGGLVVIAPRIAPAAQRASANVVATAAALCRTSAAVTTGAVGATRAGSALAAGARPFRTAGAVKAARTVGALITPTPVRQLRLARGARTAGALGALGLGIRFHALHLASAQQLDLAALLGTHARLAAALPARGLGRAAVGNVPIRCAETVGGAIRSRASGIRR